MVGRKKDNAGFVCPTALSRPELRFSSKGNKTNKNSLITRRSRTARFSCKLPVPLQERINELALQPDATRRYLHLVALGDALVQIPQEELVSATRVPGCNSVTHIDVVLNQDKSVSLRGYSDARISRGLVALLVTGLQGQPVDDILAVTADDLLSASHLHGSVSQTRINGLSSILTETKLRLKRQQTGIGAGTNTTRWTSRQGPDVAVLLSGGVDSSVALRLAVQSGARVQAFYLKIWLEDELSHLGECPWEDDLKTAREVCEQAGVELHDVPLQKEYWDRVVSYTLAETRAGRTPNPDVMCNSRIKFGAFLEHVRDFDKVVTGHYAQTRVGENGTELWCSGDEVKDQTYFLAHLTQEQISRAWFPVGGYKKEEVRRLAREMELVNQSRADSQGICFLGKVKFDDFLAHELGERRGKLVEFESGKEVGWHRGYWFFTAGQRRGVGLSGGPWYVVCKDVDKNIVFVSRAYDAKEQARNEFEFVNPSWISGDWPEGLAASEERRMRVKTRHGKRFHEALVVREGAGGRVRLTERDRGLAAGQFAVFYDYEGQCLGSGIIGADSSLRAPPKEIVRMTSSSVKLQAHFA